MKQRMQLIEQKLPILNPKKLESYEEYINFLSTKPNGGNAFEKYPNEQELTKILAVEPNWKSLSKIEKEQAKISEIQGKSFQLYLVKLRMYAGWDLVNKIKEEKPAYTELDMLYLIVKPFIGEIDELVKTSKDDSVQKKLTQMKIRLFTMLGEPKSSIKCIKKLEEFDKERQILQLENYAKTQGLLA